MADAKTQQDIEITYEIRTDNRDLVRLLDSGIAKECARMVLPQATQTRLYVTGSCRSWIHYIDLRCGNGTQKEHMDIANGCKDVFTTAFPSTSIALGWTKSEPKCKKCNGSGETKSDSGTKNLFCECHVQELQKTLDAIERANRANANWYTDKTISSLESQLGIAVTALECIPKVLRGDFPEDVPDIIKEALSQINGEQKETEWTADDMIKRG